MQIYLGRNGKREGPFSVEQVQAMLREGQVSRTDLAWYEGVSNWMPLGQVPQFQVSETGPPVLPPSTPYQPFQSAPPQPSQAATLPLQGSQRRTDGMAITSLVLGVMGLVVIPFLCSLPAIICGHLSLGRIRRSSNTLDGNGMAVGGLVTGYLGVLFWGALFAIALVFFGAVAGKGKLKLKEWGDLAMTIAVQAKANAVVAACREYASKHGGDFPVSLEALVPDYLPDARMLEVQLSPKGPKSSFEYYGGTINDPPGRLLFATRDKTNSGKRIVAYVSGIVEVEGEGAASADTQEEGEVPR